VVEKQIMLPLIIVIMIGGDTRFLVWVFVDLYFCLFPGSLVGL